MMIAMQDKFEKEIKVLYINMFEDNTLNKKSIK
jgi:hypothetical protein